MHKYILIFLILLYNIESLSSKDLIKELIYTKYIVEDNYKYDTINR